MAATETGALRIGLIGFGEAAGTFLAGWGLGGTGRVAAFDVKTEAPTTAAAMQARYAAAGITGRGDPAGALNGTALVFCLVTADQALAAARSAAQDLPAGALWLDCNSCASETKRQAAEVIESAGGRYVDVAIMAAVHPNRHKVPLLVAGPHAADAREILLALEMCPEIAGAAVGQASAVKMIRSVMVKGLEALTAECLLAARRAGVEDRVLASLQVSHPNVDWRAAGVYNLERMMVHGARRAAEMREVAATVAALGLPNPMSAATAQWQDEIARQGADPGEDDLTARLDRILATL